jgi:inhibitor of cysteine peptidase
MKQSAWINIMLVVGSTSVVMAGCQSGKGLQTQDAKEPVTYTATLSDPACGSEVVLVDHQTQIQLPSNPSTGYSWRLVSPSTLFDVVEDDYKADYAKPVVVGSGGTQVFTLKAKQVGSEKLSFEYVRQWEKDVAAVEKKTCTVKVVA